MRGLPGAKLQPSKEPAHDATAGRYAACAMIVLEAPMLPSLLFFVIDTICDDQM